MAKLIRAMLAALLGVAAVGLVAVIAAGGRPASPAPLQAGQSAATPAAPATILPIQPGTIAFGETFDPSPMAVYPAAASFAASSPFAWVAAFSAAPGALSVDVVVVRGVGAGEQVVSRTTMDLSRPDVAVYGAQAGAGFLAGLGPGSYAMRVYSGTSLLAQGAFSVSPQG